MRQSSKDRKWKVESGKWSGMARLILLLSTIHYPLSILLAEEEKFVYNSHNKRDPFYPIVSEQGEFLASTEAVENLNGDLALEGIVWDEKGGSVAIINGAIVQQGEQVGMYQVRMIQETTVLLESEEGELVLRMPAEEKGEK